jgi:hypothetical protein
LHVCDDAVKTKRRGQDRIQVGLYMPPAKLNFNLYTFTETEQFRGAPEPALNLSKEPDFGTWDSISPISVTESAHPQLLLMLA